MTRNVFRVVSMKKVNSHFCSTFPCEICDNNSTVILLRKRIEDLEQSNQRLMESCQALKAQRSACPICRDVALSKVQATIDRYFV